MPVEAPPGLLSAEVRNFLTATPPRPTTIATVNLDGSPHQTVIWFLLRGEIVIVNSRHGRRWPSNLRREGRASLSVYEGEDAVTLDCVLESEYEGEDAQADIAEMEHRYRTPEVAQREVGRYRTQRRLSFVLRPARVHIHGEPT